MIEYKFVWSMKSHINSRIGTQDLSDTSTIPCEWAIGASFSWLVNRLYVLSSHLTIQKTSVVCGMISKLSNVLSCLNLTALSAKSALPCNDDKRIWIHSFIYSIIVNVWWVVYAVLRGQILAEQALYSNCGSKWAEFQLREFKCTGHLGPLNTDCKDAVSSRNV